MIPIKIQNVQIGVLSADKLFQSQKHLPQLNQRIFEAEIQKQMEEARERTEAAEKTEKSRIEEKKKEKQERKKSREDKRQELTGKREEQVRNKIEKKPNGTIKHLDVKI